MKLPLEFYSHIRHSVRVSDIVRQKLILTKKGNEYLGLCPFHNEKTPSFTVNDNKKFYHCFGCSAHGDVIRFISEINGLSYKDAAIKIAGENGIELPKMSAAAEQQYKEEDYIYKILELAAEFFVGNLNDNSKKYLIERGLAPETIKDFSIGYAPGGNQLEQFFQEKSITLKDLAKAGLVGRKENGKIYQIFNNRIMFPIKNIYSKIVGFGGRTIGNKMPKYINSPETMVFKKSEVMYGENIATGHSYKDNYSIIVEGYMDVIALHQAGFKQAVASLGTSVTDKHIQKLWRSGDEIITCLDGDSAGLRASSRLIDMCLLRVTANKSISFIKLPPGMDPDDLIKNNGSKSFQDIFNRRIGLSEMIWQTEYNGKIFKTAESRATLENKLNQYCNRIADRALQTNFRRYFKDMSWNSFVRSKHSKKETISKELIEAKKYSESEVLEHSICAFLVQYPNITNNNDFKEIICNLELQNQNLNDLKTYIIEIIGSIEIIKFTEVAESTKIMRPKKDSLKEFIANNIKNTSFYDTYLVLSDTNVRFLDLAFLNKNNENLEQVFKWLCKKHYLLLLKQEYLDILKTNVKKVQSKSSFYLKEIQKTSKELDQLSSNFINN